MLTIFQTAFFVGIGLTVLGLVVGQIFDVMDIFDGSLDIDFHGFNIVIPLSPMLYILFLTVFGGVGWICLLSDEPLPAYLIWILAIATGIVSFILFNKLILKPLKNAQNTSSPEEQELIGLLAVVTEKIYKDGFGQISYVINDNTYHAPAKEMNGEEIPAGSQVAICEIEDNTFYVTNIKL